VNVASADVRALAARALELGAVAAQPLSAREVVVDPRVTLKCRVPLCPSYGVNLMCPPHVIGADEFADIVRRYDECLVVQQAIAMTAADVKRRFRGKPLHELVESKAYGRTLAESQNAFVELLTSLESEALAMGHRFAAALAGGDCCLCETCVAAPPAPAAAGRRASGAKGGGAKSAGAKAANGGAALVEPCRHPFKARPSAEAVGVDVVATAAAAGLTIEFPAGDDPRWTGLLLVE
jgi:predicted metal-binding protein